MDVSCESHSQVQSQGVLKSVRLVASLQPLQCTCKVSSQVPVKLCSIGLMRIVCVEMQNAAYTFRLDTLRCIKTRAMQRLWIQNAFLAGPHLNACGCETCAGEKVLVFCQWEDLKKHIAETLETMRVPHLQLSGNIYKRSDILRRFQDRITCPHLSIASYSSKMQRERFRDDID